MRLREGAPEVRGVRNYATAHLFFPLPIFVSEAYVAASLLPDGPDH